MLQRVQTLVQLNECTQVQGTNSCSGQVHTSEGGFGNEVQTVHPWLHPCCWRHWRLHQGFKRNLFLSNFILSFTILNSFKGDALRARQWDVGLDRAGRTCCLAVRPDHPWSPSGFLLVCLFVCLFLFAFVCCVCFCLFSYKFICLLSVEVSEQEDESGWEPREESCQPGWSGQGHILFDFLTCLNTFWQREARGEREWLFDIWEREREWLNPFPNFGNGNDKLHSQLLGTGKGMNIPFPIFGNGNRNFIPEFWEREWDVVIPGNDRERE